MLGAWWLARTFENRLPQPGHPSFAGLFGRTFGARTEHTVRIYIGNLSHEATEGDVREAFEAFGQVESVAVITDKLTGRPRGFGFVEMPNQAEAQAAIAGLSGTDLKGRDLTVNEARPRTEGGGGGGGGRGRGRPGGGRRRF